LIEEFRFHDLRHTAASYLAMEVATAPEIAEILGHKTLAMVKRYSHFNKSHVAKLMARMSHSRLGGTAETPTQDDESKRDTDDAE